jgi:sugar transferase (PEP-CTERM/EpsH1 system associated)
MTQPPLVLHVIHHLVIGGMENGLVNLINHMPVWRFRHAIACIEDYSDFRERLIRRDTEVIALRRSLVGVWNVRRQLFHLCRRLRPSIVHSRNMSGLDAVFPAFLAGVRCHVHGEHGWDVGDLTQNRKNRLLRRVHSPLIKRYITVSRHLQRYLVDEVGIAEKRITQIYNGVDTSRFKPAVARPLGLLPEGFADADSVIIGTVGRMRDIKDQETLVRAFAAFAMQEPYRVAKVRLALIGDGPLLCHLRQLADSLGIAPLTWFAGAAANIPEMMQLLDVFVLPSLLEGISNTILEAMATGLPVVATSVGGNLELIEDGVTGRLFRPRDVHALVRLISEYAASPRLRQSHGQHARSVAIERFSLQAMVRKYLEVYDDLLYSQPTAARPATVVGLGVDTSERHRHS